MTVPPAAITIPVYYDFSSTLCYVAHKVLERIEPEIRHLDIGFEWRPLDLARIAGWRRGARIQEAARQNVERVLRELQVATTMPARWIDSRAVHAVALGLGQSPSEVAWRERVWSAIYEEGRIIDAAGEIDRLARDLRIDLDLYHDAEFARVEEATRRAHTDGVTGVPAFMLDDWPFGGIQEDRTMIGLFERYARKKARENA